MDEDRIVEVLKFLRGKIDDGDLQHVESVLRNAISGDPNSLPTTAADSLDRLIKQRVNAASARHLERYRAMFPHSDRLG
jgi:hypothetical protein